MGDTEHSILNQCAEEGVQLDPWALRKVFLLLIQQHYSSPESFGGVPEAFKKFKYSDEIKERTLDIQLDYVYDDYEVEQRPAIFVGFSDFDFAKPVINDYQESRDDLAGKHFISPVSVALIITHISGDADEVLMLSVITGALLRALRETLRDALQVQMFEVKKITKVAAYKTNADNHFRSDVICALNYNDKWTTNIESHVIKRINAENTPAKC